MAGWWRDVDTAIEHGGDRCECNVCTCAHCAMVKVQFDVLLSESGNLFLAATGSKQKKNKAERTRKTQNDDGFRMIWAFVSFRCGRPCTLLISHSFLTFTLFSSRQRKHITTFSAISIFHIFHIIHGNLWIIHSAQPPRNAADIFHWAAAFPTGFRLFTHIFLQQLLSTMLHSLSLVRA